MADDDALTDRNKVSTLLAVDTTGQRRRVLVDTTGRFLFASNINVGTVKVEDATDPTRLLVVDANGRIGVNLSTNPLPTSISTSPLPVSATDLDIRDLSSAQDSVLAVIGTSPLPVSAVDLDIRNLSSIQDSISATISTSPLPVSSTDFDIRDLNTTQDLVLATIATSPLPVSSTDLDIRDLVIADRIQASFDRPSRDPNKTRLMGFLQGGTGSRTLVTVTTGKTLYVHTFTLSMFNSSTTAQGEILIRDGTLGKVPVLIPPSSVGAISPMSAAFNPTFIEPKNYLTDINILLVSGTVTYACSYSGYEE